MDGGWTGTAPGGSSAAWPAAPASRSLSGPYAATCVHHRGPGCRRPAAGRARSRLARRPAHHHALRPGPDLTGPARHLHRRRLPRRSRQVTPQATYPFAWSALRPGSPSARDRIAHHDATAAHEPPICTSWRSVMMAVRGARERTFCYAGKACKLSQSDDAGVVFCQFSSQVRCCRSNGLDRSPIPVNLLRALLIVVASFRLAGRGWLVVSV
jgi:hypothetical protein